VRTRSPAVAALLDVQRLAAQRLRHLLGVVARLRTHRGDVDRTPHAACRPIFPSSIGFTRGQSSSTIAYQAESRIESGSTMCLRKIPSKLAPTPSSAPRTRRLRASGLELHAHRAPAVERVREQQVLRLDVRAGAPLRPLEPRPADFGPLVERLDVQIARRADRAPIDVDDERHLSLACKRQVEPAVEAERVHVREAVDLGIALGRLPKPVSVALLDRLGADDPALQRAVGTKLGHVDGASARAGAEGWLRCTMFSIAAPDSARHYACRGDGDST